MRSARTSKCAVQRSAEPPRHRRSDLERVAIDGGGRTNVARPLQEIGLGQEAGQEIGIDRERPLDGVHLAGGVTALAAGDRKILQHQEISRRQCAGGSQEIERAVRVAALQGMHSKAR